MSTWPDRDVAAIAGRQQGRISRAQLAELGVGRALIDHSLRRGRIIQKHRGVYAVAHEAPAPFADEMAAVLAVGRGAVLSHGSAAALWELTPWRDPPPVPHVTVVARDAGRRRRGIRVHRAQERHARDVTSRHGIPVTSPARTLVDTAPGLSGRELERAFDRALKARIMTRLDAVQTAGRDSRHPGAGRVAALAAAEGRRPSEETRHENEERLLSLVRAGGLPEPELNIAVGPYSIDALWRAHRLAVEVDSYAYHSTRWSFESDHERDLTVSAAGFTVMRITAEQLDKQPAAVLVHLTRRLTALDPQSRRSSGSVT